MKAFWLTLPLLVSLGTAHAADSDSPPLLFFPSVGLGWNQLTFVRPGGTVNANYKTLNMGLTMTYGRLFASADGEWLGKANFQSGTDFTSVEREDQTLAVGMAFDRLSVFTGYTSSETKDDFFGEFHYDQGYFIGAGYDFPVGQATLGLSLAYADLDGRIYEDGVGLIESGKTRGLSYRIGYSGPFRKDMGYKLFARYRSYDFNSGGLVTDKDILSLGALITF